MYILSWQTVANARRNNSLSGAHDPMTSDARLTPKQARFVAEYLVDLNGKQAAVRAGYSRATAEQQASRLLRNAQVRAAIDAEQTARFGGG